MTETFLTTGLVLTFILNLFLNGVMGQLWCMFNTLQIIMAMRYLKVTMPANINFVLETLDSIVNFSIMDTKVLKETFIVPIFGDENETDDDEASSSLAQQF